MYELVYTSAKRGLKPGSSGFTTVIRTKGIPRQLQSFLESISTYRELAQGAAASSPENFMLLRQSIGKDHYTIISRLAYCGKDYTNRNNKIAHQFAFSDSERIEIVRVVPR